MMCMNCWFFKVGSKCYPCSCCSRLNKKSSENMFQMKGKREYYVYRDPKLTPRTFEDEWKDY